MIQRLRDDKSWNMHLNVIEQNKLISGVKEIGEEVGGIKKKYNFWKNRKQLDDVFQDRVRES